MPGSEVGACRRRGFNAAKPPADAPIPTMGKVEPSDPGPRARLVLE